MARRGRRIQEERGEVRKKQEEVYEAHKRNSLVFLGQT